MMEKSTVPYLLQLKDPSNVAILPSCDEKLDQVCPQRGSKISDIAKRSVDIESESQNFEEQVNFVYEIVYPEQFNLKPVYNLKRGRPKKKKVEERPVNVSNNVKPAPRTRSGRVIKFPKYIEKDFKKMETEGGSVYSEEQEVKTTEFERFEEDSEIKKAMEVQLEFHQRKRKISAQYRCPKCKKAYLGKSKMMQHIKKYPDHGPLPHNELNFDVWNYLVDITQKCPPAQRGIKFCEELTNLLHNVLLLTSALFKQVEQNKNHVDVDKVLGNAIGLPPGPYKFNETELYKDVTVLKLITNSDFFKPVNTNDGTEIDKSLRVVNYKETEGVDTSGTDLSKNIKNGEETPSDKEKTDFCFRTREENFPIAKTDINNTEKGSLETSLSSNFIKKMQPLEKRLPVHSDLLSDNSLLNLSNLRNSEEELILPSVESSGNLLDNSTSSDDVMNVDQFVNERFKKITEPEMEANGSGLNLDLPNLDLFQFHGS